MDDLALESAGALAAAIRKRTVSSRELLEMFLRRLERINPAVNAVITLDTERASSDARAADDRLARGEEVGPLHGLPVTIKDAIETAGIRSTGGATELANHVPRHDAPVVSRIKAAGAIVYGKTNVPRWSGDLQTFNDLFGVTNNPWDLSRTTGGSSGGAAAAVATGMTSFEIGTDIGGSVRIPSSYCGAFGHKPSFGVVPQRGYLDRVGGGDTDSDINVFGPIARSADDLDLLLSIVAGPNQDDAKAWRLELPEPRHRDLAEYRIGTWLDDPQGEVDTEVGDVLAAAASTLSRAGAVVTDDRPPVTMRESRDLFDNLIVAAISVSLDGEVGEALSGSHREWLQRQQLRAEIRSKWAEWFERYDLLLCPVMPMAAFPHDHRGTVADRTVTINGKQRSHGETLAWTGLIGVAYLPSTVVPVGRTKGGLPVGIQVAGPYLEDRSTLFVASKLADLAGGFVPPPMASDGSHT